MSIEWFRWYHGTVSDPKLALVARKAKQPRPVVVAVWASLLECASQATPRGSITKFDAESVAVALDIDEDAIPLIMDAMVAKTMIGDGKICAWEQRQVRRERDDPSAERVALHRARKAEVTPSNAKKTPSNATENQVTPPERERDTESDSETDSEEKREASGASAAPLSGGTISFFDLTPARIELARGEGFTDLAWVQTETAKFIKRRNGASLTDKLWLNWLDRGREFEAKKGIIPKAPPINARSVSGAGAIL